MRVDCTDFDLRRSANNCEPNIAYDASPSVQVVSCVSACRRDEGVMVWVVELKFRSTLLRTVSLRRFAFEPYRSQTAVDSHTCKTWRSVLL